MLKTKIILPVIAGLVLVGSVAGVSVAAAEEANDVHQSFVQKLAEKLGLSQDKVQSAMDEIHAERKAEMDQKLEEKLNQAIKDGKITEAQKQAILKKFGEEKHKPGAMVKFKGEVPEHMKEVMEQKRAEHEQWAKENGLTLELLRELHVGGSPKVKFFMHK